MLSSVKSTQLWEKNVNMKKTQYKTQFDDYIKNMDEQFVKYIDLFNAALTGFVTLNHELYENDEKIKKVKKTLDIFLCYFSTEKNANFTVTYAPLDGGYYKIDATSGNFIKRVTDHPIVLMYYLRCWFVIAHILKTTYSEISSTKSILKYGTVMFHELVDYAQLNKTYDWNLYERLLPGYQFSNVQKTEDPLSTQKVGRFNLNALAFDKGQLFPIMGKKSGNNYIPFNNDDASYTIPIIHVVKSHYQLIMMKNTPFPNQWISLLRQVFGPGYYDESTLENELKKIGNTIPRPVKEKLIPEFGKLTEKIGAIKFPEQIGIEQKGFKKIQTEFGKEQIYVKALKKSLDEATKQIQELTAKVTELGKGVIII